MSSIRSFVLRFSFCMKLNLQFLGKIDVHARFIAVQFISINAHTKGPDKSINKNLNSICL